MFAKMAFLNLWRRKSRTVLVVLMIALSLGGLMFLQGLYDGWLAETIDNTITSDGGEVVIHKNGYRLNRLPDIRIENPNAVLAQVGTLAGVARTSLRVTVDGMAATGRGNMGVQIIGLEPDEFTGGEFSRFVVEGEPFSPDAALPEAVIAVELAQKLKTRVGKKLVLTAQGLDKELSSIAVRIVGLSRTLNIALDKNAVFLPRSVAAEMLRMGDGVTSITLSLTEPSQAAEIADTLGALLGEEFEVFDWRERYAMLDYSVKMMAAFNGIHYLIIFVVVAIGITDILLISVLERIREFGILLAVGTRFSTVRGCILMESVYIGLLGYGAGVALGYGVLWYYATVGLDLSHYAEGLQLFALPSVMYAEVRWEYALHALTAVSIASLASAIIPIRVLRKKNPVQSLTMS